MMTMKTTQAADGEQTRGTFQPPRGRLPQQHPLVFERLPGAHHVLLAEGVAVLELGGRAVLHAVPHFLQSLVTLVFADAQVHGGDHLPDPSQSFGEVGMLLGLL